MIWSRDVWNIKGLSAETSADLNTVENIILGYLCINSCFIQKGMLPSPYPHLIKIGPFVKFWGLCFNNLYVCFFPCTGIPFRYLLGALLRPFHRLWALFYRINWHCPYNNLCYLRTYYLYRLKISTLWTDLFPTPTMKEIRIESFLLGDIFSSLVLVMTGLFLYMLELLIRNRLFQWIVYRFCWHLGRSRMNPSGLILFEIDMPMVIVS